METRRITISKATGIEPSIDGIRMLRYILKLREPVASRPLEAIFQAQQVAIIGVERNTYHVFIAEHRVERLRSILWHIYGGNLVFIRGKSDTGGPRIRNLGYAR